MENDRITKIGKTALTLTFISFMCKIVGFFKNSLLAYYFGTDVVVDAYVMVFSIGNIIFGWMGGFTGNLIPIYKTIYVKQGKNSADRFFLNLSSWLYIITISFMVIFFLMGDKIVSFIAYGFDYETKEITLHFFRIYCFSLIFSVIYRLYKEYLNANSRFIAAQIPDLCMSSIILLTIVACSYIGKYYLIWGYVIAIIIEAILVLSFSKIKGIKHFVTYDDNIKMVLITVIPIFLSDTLTEINTLVDKMFASNLASGSLAILNYAGTLRNVVFDVGVVAVTTILYPNISEQWSLGEKNNFIKEVDVAINFMIILFIPVTILIFAFGDVIISFVLQHGLFSADSAHMTLTVLWMYSIGLLPMVIRCIFNKVFFAMKMTGFVLVANAANILANIILNIALVKQWQHNGLALATSASTIFSLVVYLSVFKKKLRNVTYKKNLNILILSTIIFGFFGATIFALRKIFFLNCNLAENLIIMITFSTISFITYFYTLCRLKIYEADMICNIAHAMVSKFTRRLK